MQLLLDGKIEYSSCKMREGSDIIFHDRVGIIVVNTTWKLGSSWSCKPIYVIYMCGTEGRGTRSHHRVCWPYHISKHMAHSIQRRMLENMTEITMLVFIASVQAAVQLRMTNVASMKAQWARAAHALHTHHFSRLWCETGVRVGMLIPVNFPDRQPR